MELMVCFWLIIDIGAEPTRANSTLPARPKVRKKDNFTAYVEHILENIYFPYIFTRAAVRCEINQKYDFVFNEFTETL